MVRPRKSLGQSFLHDPAVQRRIVDALDPHPDDEVLEIGPGSGALTRHIAGAVRRLVAVELDERLAGALQHELGGVPGVDIVHADILDVALHDVAQDVARLKVIGNIPYNITTPLLFHLLEPRPRPALIVIMVQREVADRILADPGEKAYGALSVGVRAVASARRLFDVGRGAFRPAPAVDSTVLRILPHRPPAISPEDESALRTLTRIAFGRRRKQLQKILRSAPEYGIGVDRIAEMTAAVGLDPAQRPETLSPDEFIALARSLRIHGLPRGVA